MGRYDALYQSSPPRAAEPAIPARPATQRAAEPVQPTTLPVHPSVRTHRSDEPNARTETPTESLIDEITEGVPDHRRPTERYSFEIYTDQKPQIEELQYRFKQRTGTKLSSSRIIREAIDAYLPEALRLLADRPHTTGNTEPTER